MDGIAAGLFIGFLWLLAGSGCVHAWKDAFNDISHRGIRVTSRFAMLSLWPAWLVIWGICVAIGIAWMLIAELFE